MTPDDLARIAADITAATMIPTFYDVRVLVEYDQRVALDLETAGSAHTKGRIEAFDLPAEVRSVLDAAPKLLALVREMQGGAP